MNIKLWSPSSKIKKNQIYLNLKNLYPKDLIKILMKISKKFMIGQLKTKVIFGVVCGISQMLKVLKEILKSKK